MQAGRRASLTYLPLDELLLMIEAGAAATTGELSLTVRTRELRLSPGSTAELAVELASGMASELRGEAQLVSLFGSWTAGPWTQGFRISPVAARRSGSGAVTRLRPWPGTQWAGAGQGHVLLAGAGTQRRWR